MDLIPTAQAHIQDNSNNASWRDLNRFTCINIWQGIIINVYRLRLISICLHAKAFKLNVFLGCSLFKGVLAAGSSFINIIKSNNNNKYGYTVRANIRILNNIDYSSGDPCKRNL